MQEESKKEKREGKFKQFVKKHKILSLFIGLILLFSVSLGGTLAVLNVFNSLKYWKFNSFKEAIKYFNSFSVI